MTGGRRRCRECGKIQVAPSREPQGATDSCVSCGASLEARAFSEFADRLARFGLGDTHGPLLRGLPELPNAD